MFFYSLPLYPFLHLLSISFIFPISLFQVIQISLIWSFSIHFSFCICQSSSSLFLPVALTPNLFMSFSSHFARFSLIKVAGGMSRSNVQIVLGSIHGFTPCNSLYGKAKLHEKLICSFLSHFTCYSRNHRLSSASEQHSYRRHHKNFKHFICIL